MWSFFVERKSERERKMFTEKRDVIVLELEEDRNPGFYDARSSFDFDR